MVKVLNKNWTEEEIKEAEYALDEMSKIAAGAIVDMLEICKGCKKLNNGAALSAVGHIQIASFYGLVESVAGQEMAPRLFAEMVKRISAATMMDFITNGSGNVH